MPKTPKTLYREDMEAMKCPCGGKDCEDETIFLHGECHPGEGTWTYYDKEAHRLRIICAVCEEPVAQLAIAHKNEETSSEGLN